MTLMPNLLIFQIIYSSHLKQLYFFVVSIKNSKEQNLITFDSSMKFNFLCSLINIHWNIDTIGNDSFC